MTSSPRVRRQSVRTMVSQPTTAEPPEATQPAAAPPPIQDEPIRQESQALPPVPVSATSPSLAQTTTNAQAKREKLGWKVRVDLIKRCKQIALDEDRHDYEVLEELLEAGIEQRRR